jgi:sRNA-binding carbon storage regulator CsrA
MLCVSRRKNETIIIDLSKLTPDQLLTMQRQGAARIVVMVTEVRTDKFVKIGVDACPFIPAHRGEVQRQIDEGAAK